MVKEQQLQEKQRQRYEEWGRAEGNIEHPTHLQTLLKPEQQRRIQWLRDRCWLEQDILDIGCSWGYILNKLQGRCGVDINPESIEKGQKEFPHIEFKVGDVIKGLNIPDRKYAIVIEADLLEHLEWFEGVEKGLMEGLRIARNKLLITLPWKPTSDCALCFKHQWVPSAITVGSILAWLINKTNGLGISCDGDFVYIEVKC